MTNEIPRRRGTPAQRAIAVRAIRSIRRSRSITGLHCLHHAADELARTAAVRLDAGFTDEATDIAAAYVLVEAIATHVRADRWNRIVR